MPLSGSKAPAPLFPPPPGWDSSPLKLRQRRASLALIPVVQDAAFLAWRESLPAAEVRRFCRKIQTAVNATIALLSRQIPRSVREPCPLYPWLPSIPAYWEPAEAPGSDRLMPVQRCAYRWAAAVLGRFVRDALEELRAQHAVPDGCMLALNRSVRDAAFGVMIQDPLTGYLLAQHLTVLPRVARVAQDLDACPFEKRPGLPLPSNEKRLPCTSHDSLSMVG